MKNVSYTLFDSCDQTPEYTAQMHGILALIDGTAVMHATQDIRQFSEPCFRKIVVQQFLDKLDNNAAYCQISR